MEQARRHSCFYSTVSIAIGFFLAMQCILAMADPIPATICDVNQRIGVVDGDLVQVEGVCTVSTGRLGNSLTIISDPLGGPYCCGLALYDTSETLIAEQGQCVRAWGTVSDYYDVTEIYLDPSYPPEVWDCEWTMPAPEEIVDCAADLAPYTNCILTFKCLTITEVPDQYGNYIFADRYGCSWNLLQRRFDPPRPVGDEFCALTGVLDYHFGEFKLRPRDDTDYDLRPHADCPFCEGVCDPVTIDATMSIEAPVPITEGDPFIHQVTWKNHCAPRNAVLFDVLEIEGLFWFWPTWTHEINGKFLTLPNFDSYAEEIFNFTWPADVAVEIHGTFYSAAMDPDSLVLISDIASVEFYAL